MRSGQTDQETFPARDFIVRIGHKITMSAAIKPLGTAVVRVSGASVSCRLNLDGDAIRSVVDSRLEQVFRRRLTRRIESHALDRARNDAQACEWSEEDCIETVVTEEKAGG